MSLRSERWVLCIWPSGHEELIKRTEAQSLVEDREAEYGGVKAGRECVVMKSVWTWRKTVRRNEFGEKTGMAQMSPVRM